MKDNTLICGFTGERECHDLSLFHEKKNQQG